MVRSGGGCDRCHRHCAGVLQWEAVGDGGGGDSGGGVATVVRRWVLQWEEVEVVVVVVAVASSSPLVSPLLLTSCHCGIGHGCHVNTGW